MWEQNKLIGNPHRIKPGMRLTLYPGMFELPAEPVAAPESPPPPPALEPPPAPEPELFHPLVGDIGYLSPEKPDVVGRIAGAGDPLYLTLGEGMKALLEFPGATPAVGSRYRVVHVSEERVRHPLTGEPLGYKHTFPAVIEVAEVREAVAVGVVTESYSEVEVGDGLVPWFPMPDGLVLRRGGARAEGRLVAAQEYRYNLGEGHLVFVDVGAGDGIQPGQVLSIWRERRVDEGQVVSDFEATRLGEMVVLLVRPDTATALVTVSNKDLSEGDIVRTEP